jgi:tRNA threonylcarbamoyladenosine biosynthesis protein TsaB
MFLAVDTSSKNISFAIWRKGKVIVDSNKLRDFGAGQFLPDLEQQLKRHKLKLNNFKAFIVGYGPGSFTGMRISFAAMKALNLALNKPIIIVGSLFAMAKPFFEKEKVILVLTDARKNLIYSAVFKNGVMRGKEKLTSLDDAVDGRESFFMITYDANIRAAVLAKNPKANFYAKDVYPKASNLLAEGIKLYQEKKFTPLEKLEPLYLHPKDCQVRNK